MLIKRMVVECENRDGEVEIARVKDGARVAVGRRTVCRFRCDDDEDTRWAAAVVAAAAICGADRSGRPNATNSMIHDVLNELERVANC